MVHVFFSPAAFLYGSLEQFDSPESPNPLAAADVDIVGRFQIVEIGMLLQVGTEGLLGESIQCIVGTPLLVHHVEIFGTGFAVGLEPEVALRLHELHDVVSISHGSVDITLCPFTDGKVVVVLNQPVQPFQCPQEDALLFLTEFFCQERIVYSVGITVFGFQDNLSSEESVAAIMECLQGSVSESN